jgi:hypothetical protein
VKIAPRRNHAARIIAWPAVAGVLALLLLLALAAIVFLVWYIAVLP